MFIVKIDGDAYGFKEDDFEDLISCLAYFHSACDVRIDVEFGCVHSIHNLSILF